MNESLEKFHAEALAISRRRFRLAAVAMLLLAAMAVPFGEGNSAPSQDTAPLMGEMVVSATRLA